MTAAAILTVTWASADPAVIQDCCHRLPDGEKRTAASAPGLVPMSVLDIDAVRQEFNASSGKVRLVALLSPTCSTCQSGHGAIAQILKKFSSPKLSGILVWEPMREGDSREAATRQADTVRDARIVQGWNETKRVGKAFGETLGLHGIAWDVYLVYEPGITWEAQQPPQPTFWMHQLEGGDPNLMLCESPARLSAEVETLLAKTH